MSRGSTAFAPVLQSSLRDLAGQNRRSGLELAKERRFTVQTRGVPARGREWRFAVTVAKELDSTAS